MSVNNIDELLEGTASSSELSDNHLAEEIWDEVEKDHSDNKGFSLKTFINTFLRIF